jgi:hypothetical protein
VPGAGRRASSGPGGVAASVPRTREIALYSRAFDSLTKLAKYGKGAKDIIHTALATFR